MAPGLRNGQAERERGRLSPWSDIGPASAAIVRSAAGQSAAGTVGAEGRHANVHQLRVGLPERRGIEAGFVEETRWAGVEDEIGAPDHELEEARAAFGASSRSRTTDRLLRL